MAKKKRDDKYRPDRQEVPVEDAPLSGEALSPDEDIPPEAVVSEEDISPDEAMPEDEAAFDDEAAPLEEEDDGTMLVPDAPDPDEDEEPDQFDELFSREDPAPAGLKGKFSALLGGKGAGALKERFSAAAASAKEGARGLKDKLASAVKKAPNNAEEALDEDFDEVEDAADEDQVEEAVDEGVDGDLDEVGDADAEKPHSAVRGRFTQEQKAELREKALVLKSKAKAQMRKSVEGNVHMPTGGLQAIPKNRTAPTVGRTLKSSEMLVYDSELDEIDYTDDEDLPELRDYMPIRFRRYGRSGLGGGLLYALFVISVSIILACFAWMCAVDVLALNKEPVQMPVTIAPYRPTGDMPTTVTMEDENGDPEEVEIKVDIDQVADALKEAGIIEYKWLFKIFSQFSHANTKIDPGTYTVSTALDYRALVTVMQFGSQTQEVVQVTFPEGFSTEQIFTLLQSSNVSWTDELYETAANFDFDYPFLEDIPMGSETRLEGFLFPDTYEFYQGEDPDKAISRFLDNTANKLNEDIMAQVEESGRSLYDIITIASLIEKEAGAAEGEREKMASVIYNRLAADMPLGLDSTINYIKGTSTFHLTVDDLAIDDPYNTYIYKGLPPGPICNPGMASIKAALNPASTDYYYWYSVDGVSTFFKTLDEQQAFAHDHPY